MNYCGNCYKNKEKSLTFKFLDCVKFTSRNRICVNYKKIQELKNKNKIYPKLKESSHKEGVDNNSESLNSHEYQSEKINTQNNNTLTYVNKQNLLTIDLDKISSLKHIDHISSKVKYIESYIVQLLLQLDKEFEDFNIDVVHMVNELVDT